MSLAVTDVAVQPKQSLWQLATAFEEGEDMGRRWGERRNIERGQLAHLVWSEASEDLITNYNAHR